MKHTMSFKCPFCGKTRHYDFNDEEYKEMTRPVTNNSNRKVPAYMRELLITGMCYGCQSRTFHVSTPGFDLGEEIGECENCGTTLYASDKAKGHCAVCYAKI